MAKLTPEMKDFIEKGRDPITVFVGTADTGSMPNVSAKGSFIHIVDDETLAYADVYSRKTLENVKQNPQVTIAVVNAKTFKGYQFKGRGEVVEGGPLVDQARKKNPQSQTVTIVRLEAVYSMDYGPGAGEKIA